MVAVEAFVRDLVILLVAAFLGGTVAKKFSYPAAIGELIVGIIIGPFALGFVEFSETLVIFAELGTIILLFYIGLEADVGLLKRHLMPSTLCGISGALVPLAVGYYGGIAMGFSGSESLFLGVVITATSIGITVRMLADLGKMRTKEGTTILGAGVVDDILAIIILSVTISVLLGEFSPTELFSVLGKAVAFWAVTIVVGFTILARVLNRMRVGAESMTLLVLALGFAGAFVSSELGLSSAIGAFAIGVVLSKMRKANQILDNLQPIFLFFVPIFFLSIGMLVDPRAFLSSLLPGLLLALLAVISKIAGSAGALLLTKYSRHEALTVAVGMIPRGEVGLIIAGTGLASGFIGSNAYLVAVIAVSLTTFIALPILKFMIKE